MLPYVIKTNLISMNSIRFLIYGPDTATPLQYMEFSQGQIIQELNKQELSSLCLTHCQCMMNQLVKFHEYILFGLGVMTWKLLHVWTHDGVKS